jgi:hypothetical protein
MLVVTLILPGALIATLGVAGPSSVVTFIGSGLW